MEAGKIAIETFNKYLTIGVTFNQETTLCGKSILSNIQKAKQLGYLIEVHYVGVDNVDIAKKRIEERVHVGGHGIPDKDVERRYNNSFAQLKLIWNEVDMLILYDNSFNLRRFALYKRGVVFRLSSTLPNWFILNGFDKALDGNS